MFCVELHFICWTLDNGASTYKFIIYGLTRSYNCYITRLPANDNVKKLIAKHDSPFKWRFFIGTHTHIIYVKISWVTVLSFFFFSNSIPAQLIYNLKNLYAQHVSKKNKLCARYTNAPAQQVNIERSLNNLSCRWTNMFCRNPDFGLFLDYKSVLFTKCTFALTKLWFRVLYKNR